ncbi:MAG: hypothetical protein Q8P49_03350 [Candidatus Liptonbacteria bacterium]|nr:hypothetical protein [Candidatus Liptonbacteria bacterium]
MKFVSAIILTGLVVFLGIQIYTFIGKERKIRQEFSNFEVQLQAAKLDEAKSRADLDYYLNPANLEKELRARFNYKAFGENLLILVPRNQSSAQP